MQPTLVIADDHPFIRVEIHTQLTQLGYKNIFEAWDQKLLKNAVNKKPSIGLVLLDVVMPRMIVLNVR
ncbi:MAG: hypothetical protein RI918_2044 [Pseudomonadota bacterium]|jgi:DNA-binding NarL/FixJ family response regulator